MEEGRITGDAYNQIAVLLGMLLRVQKRLTIDDVVLDMPAFEFVKERTDESGKLVDACLRGEYGRGNLLVEQHAAGDLRGFELADGAEYAGGTVLVGRVGG